MTPLLSSWCCPLPFGLVPTACAHSFRDMPPGWTGLPMEGHPGAFGTVRTHHVHEGVDLYCPAGTPVMAVEAGTVAAIEHFTGSRADPPSPWWLDTQAILVEGASGTVLYGEIDPRPCMVPGAQVQPGEELGCVVRVLRHDKGRPTEMLHLELHASGTRRSMPWDLRSPRPPSLRDPTASLRRIAGRPISSLGD